MIFHISIKHFIYTIFSCIFYMWIQLSIWFILVNQTFPSLASSEKKTSPTTVRYSSHIWHMVLILWFHCMIQNAVSLVNSSYFLAKNHIVSCEAICFVSHAFGIYIKPQKADTPERDSWYASRCYSIVIKNNHWVKERVCVCS